MFGTSAASRRFLRLRRLLIGLQISLLIFSMAAPVGTLAADPSADPGDSPAPSSEPAATPDPTPEATGTPTAEPTAEPT